MDNFIRWICLIGLFQLIAAAPPTRRTGGYGKPGGFELSKDAAFHESHHFHHQQQQQLATGQDDQGWFNGQVQESPVEWPEEADEVEDDNQQHHNNGGQTNAQDVEGSAGPWVGLPDSTVWPDSKKKSVAVGSWPTTYSPNGKRNGKNGRPKTTSAPTWPPKPIVPQGGWADPNIQTEDGVWPSDSPAVQLHKKFHGNKNGNGKVSKSDHGLDTPTKTSSWPEAPVKDTPWPTVAASRPNGNGKNGNGKRNGNQRYEGDKPALIGWDQVPTGYAQKRPTWTKKKDHVIKFKESKFSQTDYTAPSDDKPNDGAWPEEEDEEAGWVDEAVGPKPSSWPNDKPSNGHHTSRNGARFSSIKSNGSRGSGVWRDSTTQSWPRTTSSKHTKWSNAHHRTGGDIQGPGTHHHRSAQLNHQGGHHYQNGSGTSTLNNGWLDLQKELYLLKNKVRVSSGNPGWPPVGSSKDAAWKQQWNTDQEPSSSATRMVTKVVFAESLPKGEKMVMRWTPPVSYQVSN